jgi:hypothetical protein
MAVEILWLTDLSCPGATEAAESLIDLRTGPADLSKLLMIDHVSLLTGHGPVFRRLASSGRVKNLLCVAVGPRPPGTRELPLPPSLAGTQGPGILWVGDPDGIDWRAASGATIIGRKRGDRDGLTRVVELLHVEAVFDKVHEVARTAFPWHRTARSPGTSPRSRPP